MTSQINPNNINGAYPVAGQDNNSQGFRDNFTNTANNFTFAANEITELQSKAIVNTQLSGGNALTTQNNMLNSPLINALISDFAAVRVALGTLTGAVTVNYQTAHYYTVTTGSSLTVNFTNWPAAGQLGLVTLEVTVTNPAYTLTLPTSVSVNGAGIQGWTPASGGSSPVITFAAAGVYTFTFTTTTGGSTVTISENNTTLRPFNASSDLVATGNAASLGTATSYFTTATTATLAAGVSGQTKVLAKIGSGSTVVTVANHGWSGSGTATLGSQGAACTLTYIDGVWICTGNNGATFA